MTEAPKRTRPEAVPHTPASLRALAAQIRDHAAKIEDAAKLLENAGPALAVKLNYLVSVEAGLTAIRNVAHEVTMKVDNKKFLKITGVRPDAKAPPTKRPKRS